MPDQLQLRGGTTTEHNSFTGAIREVTVDTTKKTLVVHDGSQAGGTALMKESGSNAASTVGIGVGGANKITINADGHVDIASNLDCAAGLDVTGAITCTGGLTVDTNTLFVNGSNNRVGIGTASPDTTLSVSGTGDGVVNIDTSDSRGAFVRFGQGGSFHNMVGCADGLTSGDKEDLGVRAADNIIFAAGGSSEKMRIDSSGFLGIGNTSPNLSQAGARDLVIGAGSGDRGLTIMSGASGVGHIEFSDGTSTAAEKTAGGIRYYHDSNYMRFNTNGGTERMRIDSSGNVGIGTTSPSGLLHLRYSDSQTYNTDIRSAGLKVENNDGTDNTYTQIHLRTGNSDAFLRAIREGSNLTSLAFLIDNGGNTSVAGEAMRIDSSGNLCIGETGEPSAGSDGIRFEASGRTKLSTTGTGESNVFEFKNANGNVGKIVTQNSNTTYGTSSDYRLKENVVAISDGITRLKQLKPSRFNFIVKKDLTQDGFLAHEVQSVVPEAISGEKDAVKEDGSIDPQAIDLGRLVPLLVAAVQELIGKVEALEAA